MFVIKFFIKKRYAVTRMFMIFFGMLDVDAKGCLCTHTLDNSIFVLLHLPSGWSKTYP